MWFYCCDNKQQEVDAIQDAVKLKTEVEWNDEQKTVQHNICLSHNARQKYAKPCLVGSF